MTSEFVSGEASQFWRYIESTLDRLFELVAAEREDVLHWLPPAENPNSILVLARHMLANVEVNIRGTLGDEPVAYDREAAFAEDITKADVLARWSELRPLFQQTMRALPDDRISGLVTHHWRGEIPGREVLIVVARHTAEHLAHAELTRDMARVATQAR
jgi:hypothetical protein